MKAQYALGLFLALASCKGSELAATTEPAAPSVVTPHVPTMSPQPSPGLANYTKQVAESDKLQPVPPAAPVNPTKAELKAYEKRLKLYEKQLKAWEKVQVAQAQAYAKANRQPLILGKGAQNAPNATAPVQNSYKPDAPVAQATDSAVLQNTGGGAAAAGPNASAQGGATRPDALSPFAVIADNLTSPVGYVLAAAAVGGLAYALYWLWPILFRRKSTETTT